MKNLYYSVPSDITFWIYGYAPQGSVLAIITFLNECLVEFSNELKINDLSKVNTFEIRQSSRYKYMQVFYISGKFEHEDLLIWDNLTFEEIING